MRVAGHALIGKGRAFEYLWTTTALLHVRGPVGRAVCSCGQVSESLPSTAARRRWHDRHKTYLRDGIE